LTATTSKKVKGTIWNLLIPPVNYRNISNS
jgi:hypothetical protein